MAPLRRNQEHFNIFLKKFSIGQPVNFAMVSDTFGTPESNNEVEIMRGLRLAKHFTLAHIAMKEALGVTDIDAACNEVSIAGKSILQLALQASTELPGAPHPWPQYQNHPLRYFIVGMGKFGSQELNIGSDIDICFFYETAEDDHIRFVAAEFFAYLSRRIVTLVSKSTEEGFCYRVDLRLRPDGNSGPIAMGVDAAERYYQVWGQPWERAALLRANVVSGDEEFGRQFLDRLQRFVFQKEVNPQIAQTMRDLVEQSRLEHKAHAQDIKLGRGGIREAEFFVQSLQLIWGGVHPSLRVAGTIDAMLRLKALGLISDLEFQDISQAWAFLRKLEHRIQLRVGYQTHTLSQRQDELEELASSMGLSATKLLQRLDTCRDIVGNAFDSLFEFEPNSPKTSSFHHFANFVADAQNAEHIARQIPETLHLRDPEEAASNFWRLKRHRTSPFGRAARQQLPAFGEGLLEMLQSAADPDASLALAADFFSKLGGDWGYGRLMTQHPELMRRIFASLGAAKRIGHMLIGHPEQLDTLLAESEIPSNQSIVKRHQTLKNAIDRDLLDEETAIGHLRQIKRDITFLLASHWIAGSIDIQSLQNAMSTLAFVQLNIAATYIHRMLEKQAGSKLTQPIICGMGSASAFEMIFDSDVDLVFLYDEKQSGDASLYGTFATRLVRMLTQPNYEGPGFHTDTRLRPQGNHGWLVTSLAGFEKYHLTQAQDWERQALIKARPLWGSPELKHRTHHLILELLRRGGPPDPNKIRLLRARLQKEIGLETPNAWDPKHGFGGLLDIEFAIQFLQLKHGQFGIPRTRNAIQHLAKTAIIDEQTADQLLDCQQYFRRVLLALRLRNPANEHRLLVRRSDLHYLGNCLRTRVDRQMTLEQRVIERYQWRAEEVRRMCEVLLGPIPDAPAPWR